MDWFYVVVLFFCCVGQLAVAVEYNKKAIEKNSFPDVKKTDIKDCVVCDERASNKEFDSDSLWRLALSNLQIKEREIEKWLKRKR